MSDTAKRDAVQMHYRGIALVCEENATLRADVDRLRAAIERVRAENAALAAAVERVQAACENDLRWVDAQPILRALEETP